jgi:glycine cleavage system H protein
MADNPTDYRYLESHEWHKKEADGTISIGVTEHAAEELDQVTFVGLPKVGTKVAKGQNWGIIESHKASNDLYSGVSGTVTAVNEELVGSPEIVNADPFNRGWMIKIKPENPAEFDQLLSAEDYEKIIAH